MHQLWWISILWWWQHVAAILSYPFQELGSLGSYSIVLSTLYRSSKLNANVQIPQSKFKDGSMSWFASLEIVGMVHSPLLCYTPTPEHFGVRRKKIQEPRMVDQRTFENQYLKLFLVDKAHGGLQA